MERFFYDYIVDEKLGPRIFSHSPISDAVGSDTLNRVLYFIRGYFVWF